MILGPYTVRPIFLLIVREQEKNPRFLDELEESLAKHVCRYIKALGRATSPKPISLRVRWGKTSRNAQ